jgi:hypothetical protein
MVGCLGGNRKDCRNRKVGPHGRGFVSGAIDRGPIQSTHINRILLSGRPLAR